MANYELKKLNLKTGDVVEENHFRIIDDNLEVINNFIKEPQYTISDERYEELEKNIFGL